MYFKDLTEFSYMLNEPSSHILNVGWLEPSVIYASQAPKPELLVKLKSIVVGNESVDIHMNRIRGVLPCRICKEGRLTIENEEGKSSLLGMSELLIPSTKKGQFYASPSMIVHYIEHHLYKAPKEFWKAVDKFDMNCHYNAQDTFDALVGDE